jgi:peptidoglycan/LPS O-acetylase OafA/YrhL
MNWLNATPLRALVAGPEMVLLFFVLSGMVLALPRLAGHGASYGRYLLTRVLRLYPAAWVVTAIAALALLVEPAHPQAGLSTSWLANEFSAPINPADAFHYVGLIVPFDPTRLDGVLWSLELELRTSLLLPLLVWFACRCGPVVTLVSAIALIVYGTTASLAAASWIWTTVVIGCFLLGILLARHRDTLNRSWAALPTVGRRLVGLAILLCFWLPTLGVNGRVGNLPIGYLLPILGACAAIVVAQGPGMRGWLSGRVPAWLGRISYSLYLVHCVVLKLIATVVPNGGSPILLAPAGIAISLVLATILQRTVEAPAIKLAKTAWTTRQEHPATWRHRSSLSA